MAADSGSYRPRDPKVRFVAFLLAIIALLVAGHMAGSAVGNPKLGLATAIGLSALAIILKL
jgi:hypothetical protein